LCVGGPHPPPPNPQSPIPNPQSPRNNLVLNKKIFYLNFNNKNITIYIKKLIKKKYYIIMALYSFIILTSYSSKISISLFIVISYIFYFSNSPRFAALFNILSVIFFVIIKPIQRTPSITFSV